MMLTQLASCWGTASKTVVLNKPPCTIPPWPSDPGIEEIEDDCPNTAVCLSIASASALATWIRQELRIREKLDACDTVVHTPLPTL